MSAANRGSLLPGPAATPRFAIAHRRRRGDQSIEVQPKRIRGMRMFMEDRKVEEGYVITQRLDDFKVLDVTGARPGAEDKPIGKVASVPAPLACYWMST